ncbi:MAG TPA: TetR/AcrR family transcriptional regulator [Thermoleophilaceae bacterium]
MARPRQFDTDEALDAAMRLFWSAGFRGTSVDDLTAATGLSRSSLYNVFSGKHALFVRALEHYRSLVVPEKMGELASDDASIGEVRAYLGGLVEDLLTEDGRQGCLLVNTAVELAAEDDEVADVVRAHQHLLAESVEKALRNAVKRGEIAPLADPAASARALVATAHGLMVIGKADPDEQLLRTIADSALAPFSPVA